MTRRPAPASNVNPLPSDCKKGLVCLQNQLHRGLAGDLRAPETKDVHLAVPTGNVT